MLHSFREKLIEQLLGHPSAIRLHFHLWNSRDYPNLHDYAMYSGKQLDIRVLDEMSTLRRKSMWEKTRMINFASIMQIYLNSGTAQTITDTGGTGRSISSITSIGQVMDGTGPSANSTYGVVVGSSAAAFSRTDTKLNTQVTHGATSSTLSHGASSVGAVTNPSGNINRVQFQRSFTGNAGSTVNIQEDGMYVQSGTGAWKFCLSRNLNSFGSVGAAQVVTVTRNWDDPTT